MADESVQQLAKNFAAGFIACQMGVSLPTALKNIERQLGDQPVSDYWLTVAEKVLADFVSG